MLFKSNRNYTGGLYGDEIKCEGDEGFNKEVNIHVQAIKEKVKNNSFVKYHVPRDYHFILESVLNDAGYSVRSVVSYEDYIEITRY